MRSERAALAFGMGLCLMTAVTACGGAVTDDPGATSASEQATTSPATSVRPTLTAPKLQPPSQDNRYTSASGRPKVVVDPCTWIPDETIRELNLDPATRKRGKDLVAEYTFLTCDFTSAPSNARWSVLVDSGNVSLDEVRQKYVGQFENIDINGREAVKTAKTRNASCAVDMKTEVGYFGVDVILNHASSADTESPCDKAMELARGLEPVIGAGN
ncbi:DUF3558 domain-containing protein [Nocardia sp. NPDC058658]|uniref:DUF3558 domain-containing protein n=1 Tax=Nocardia sp. NPDC058658 TaxID=3346580 RepID=UPI0036510207